MHQYPYLKYAVIKLMKRTSLVTCFLLLGLCSVLAQGKLSNRQYEVELYRQAAVRVRHLASGRTFVLQPEFTLLKRSENPVLKYTFSNATPYAPNTNKKIRIPYWQKENDKGTTADYFETARPVKLTARKAIVSADGIEWQFAPGKEGQLKATLSLTEAAAEPVIRYQFTPNEEAWYSIGYTGMPELDPGKADAIWQPFIWQEKRFPEKPFLSTEDLCGLPGTMVEKDGVTYGVLADPAAIPYRLPYQPKGNILFGVLVRNQKGLAQPQLFSPVLGNPDSKLKAGQGHSFAFRVYAYKGKQPDAYIAAARDVFGFRDYRENVYYNLNQTIENMIDFQMDDEYSRWSKDMKGFDYSTDVANTVKNVSSLHPLSAAFITDNQGIYTRRALPIIEYLMSREKYLFSVNKNITHQNPSSRMNGPAVEVSELAVLDLFYQGASPVFRYYADSLSHVTRKLNLLKDSKGDDWPNLLALYKMTGDQQYLERARKKADDYIQWRIKTPQTDFSDASTEQSAMFWTDYSPLWMEMLSLYEATREQRYLDAAAAGAKMYMQYTWFYPVIPDSLLVVNKNGVSEFLCQEAVRDKIPPMAAPRQELPAWRVSQIGLTPEATYTSSWNPAIFLASQAPHLLRLAHYTKDDFFRAVGRSAVVGRYSNYPGYDINGEFNTVYARADYPMRYQHEVSYNQFYYNHVWPQIAMLFDYLISDVYASSKGQIHFPPELAVGYAYMKTNVYGQQPGSFYGDKGVQLWMPRQVLRVDNEQINYLTGYGNGKFYLALLNQSDRVQEVEVVLNPDLVPVGVNQIHTARLWNNNDKSVAAQVVNGRMKVTLQPKGIAAVAVDDVQVVTQFQQKIAEAQAAGSTKSYHVGESAFGKIRSAIFSYGELSSAFVWLEANDEQAREVTFSYRLQGQKEWKTYTDKSYPFELSVPLEHGEKEMEYFVEAFLVDGKREKSEIVRLNRGIDKHSGQQGELSVK